MTTTLHKRALVFLQLGVKKEKKKVKRKSIKSYVKPIFT